MREVHYLALHYHWSESEILNLQRDRRRGYLALLSTDKTDLFLSIYTDPRNQRLKVLKWRITSNALHLQRVAEPLSPTAE